MRSRETALGATIRFFERYAGIDRADKTNKPNGTGLPDGGVEHAGNPVAGHRARTEFDKIAPGETHDASFERGMDRPGVGVGQSW